MQRNLVFLSGGILSILLSMLVRRYAPEAALSHFFEGVFVGMALPLLLYGTYLSTREKN